MAVSSSKSHSSAKSPVAETFLGETTCLIK